MLCHISARVGVIRMSTSAEPDSGITGVAVILFVTKDTESLFGKEFIGTHSIEAFLVTVELQGGL